MAFMGKVQEVIARELADVPNMVISLYTQGVSFDVSQKPYIDEDEAVHLFVNARDGQIAMAIEDFNMHKRRENSFDRTTHRATFN